MSDMNQLRSVVPDVERVDIVDDRYIVDARLLAGAFGIPLEATKAGLRSGTISSRSEQGIGEDEGRSRLTFYHGSRAFRLTIDGEGTILKRTRFNVAQRSRAAPVQGESS